MARESLSAVFTQNRLFGPDCVKILFLMLSRGKAVKVESVRWGRFPVRDVFKDHCWYNCWLKRTLPEAEVVYGIYASRREIT